MKLSDFTNYIGDVNLEYGGLFINLDDWKYGYADCLRVTDLDSGCGFTGAVMVERITALFGHGWKEEMQSAMSYIGNPPVKDMDIHSRKILLVDAMTSYGLYDPVSDMTGDHRWIIQTDPDEGYAPMEYDGWKADVRLNEDQDLFEYLLDEGFLSEYE